jgi:hypothetical protein
MYEWDEGKARTNRIKHGIAFDAAYQFDWNTSIEEVDDRESSELRIKAIGFIGVTLHIMVFTPRSGKIRIISLRKATKGEERDYEKQTRRH